MPKRPTRKSVITIVYKKCRGEGPERPPSGSRKVLGERMSERSYLYLCYVLRRLLMLVLWSYLGQEASVFLTD